MHRVAPCLRIPRPPFIPSPRLPHGSRAFTERRRSVRAFALADPVSVSSLVETHHAVRRAGTDFTRGSHRHLPARRRHVRDVPLAPSPRAARRGLGVDALADRPLHPPPAPRGARRRGVEHRVPGAHPPRDRRERRAPHAVRAAGRSGTWRRACATRWRTSGSSPAPPERTPARWRGAPRSATSTVMRLRAPKVTLFLAASLALLSLSAGASAQQTPPDVVKLRDGSMFRGTIAELVAHDHVDIVLSSGQTRRFPLADVTYAGPSVAPASAPPSPPPPPPPPPPSGGPQPLVGMRGPRAELRLEANDSDVEFHVRTGTAQLQGVGWGDATRTRSSARKPSTARFALRRARRRCRPAPTTSVSRTTARGSSRPRSRSSSPGRAPFTGRTRHTWGSASPGCSSKSARSSRAP